MVDPEKKMPANILNYNLYGENRTAPFSDLLHIEKISARGPLYGWDFRPHQHHRLHQFFYILKGSGCAVFNKTNYEITSNMFIGIPPMIIHGFQFQPNTEGWVLSVPRTYLNKALENNFIFLQHFNRLIIYPSEDLHSQQEIQRLFKSLESEFNEKLPGYELALPSLATLLFTKMARLLPAERSQPDGPTSQKQLLLATFQNLLDKKFKERPSIKHYASMLGITPTHLNRICRTTTNKSAIELLHERTLLEAQKILIYTSMTIAEISYELGFCDPAHFSKFFKQKTSQKPSHFRKDHIKLLKK